MQNGNNTTELPNNIDSICEEIRQNSNKSDINFNNSLEPIKQKLDTLTQERNYFDRDEFEKLIKKLENIVDSSQSNLLGNSLSNQYLNLNDFLTQIEQKLNIFVKDQSNSDDINKISQELKQLTNLLVDGEGKSILYYIGKNQKQLKIENSESTSSSLETEQLQTTIGQLQKLENEKKEWEKEKTSLEKKWSKEINETEKDRDDYERKCESFEFENTKLQCKLSKLKNELRMSQYNLQLQNQQPSKEEKTKLASDIKRYIPEYKQNLKLLNSVLKKEYSSNQRSEVTETQTSFIDRRNNSSEEVILEVPKTNIGSFYILCLSGNKGYLFPKNNKFKTSEKPTAQALFDGYNQEDSSFSLERPAIVSKIDDNKWELVEKGDLNLD